MSQAVIGALRVELGLDSARFQEGIRRAKGSLARLQRETTRLGPAIAAAAAASVAGLGILVARSAESADQIVRLSQVANATPAAFQRLAAGAKRYGIDQEKLGDLLKDFNDRVGDFTSTGGGPMRDFFEQIAPKVGVTAEQFSKLSGPEGLELYISSLQKAGVTQQEMVFFLEALGSDLSLLLPLYQDNSAELNRLADEAEALGATMDTKTLAAMQRVDASMDRLGVAATGLGNRLVTAFAPAIETVVNALTGLVDWLGRAVGRVFQFGRQVLQVLGLIDRTKEEQLTQLQKERARNTEAQLALMANPPQSSGNARKGAMTAREKHQLKMNTLLEQEQVLVGKISALRKEIADNKPDLPEIKPVTLPGVNTGTSAGGGGAAPRAGASSEADRFAERLTRIGAETEAIRKRTGLVGAETAVRDAYAASIEAARVEEDLLRAAQSAQIDVSEDLTAAIAKAAEARRQAVLGEARAEDVYRTAQEAERARLAQIQSTLRDVTSPLKDMLRQGEFSLRSFAQTTARVFENLADQLLNGAFARISDGLTKALSGGGGTGGGGFDWLGALANLAGSAFGASTGAAFPTTLAGAGIGGTSLTFAPGDAVIGALGGIKPFAKGGIVNRATTFAMRGGGFGVMGEAGAEAILPLSKGPDGSMGVALNGPRDNGPTDQRVIIVDSVQRAQDLVRPNSRDWIVEMDRLGYERKR